MYGTRVHGIHGTTDCGWSMVGVHDGCDAWPWSGDDKVMAEVEAGGKRCIGCIGCSEKSKRGSGGRSNTGEGHLLVVEEQT